MAVAISTTHHIETMAVAISTTHRIETMAVAKPKLKFLLKNQKKNKFLTIQFMTHFAAGSTASSNWFGCWNKLLRTTD
ncbi:hypothetical protein FRX31_018133 [Thalictrum thalictroides]|uniref:Uncharacterized protein n=1 Tax=Thalictrum thalictroides TaxID=46969 RepID=A0A7J6W4I4_THATH|nr:hypothetical protein FRX31_018133 [Thalictrum thalictroides]